MSTSTQLQGKITRPHPATQPQTVPTEATEALPEQIIPIQQPFVLIRRSPYKFPANGVVILRLAGTGSIATVTLGGYAVTEGTAYNLNSGIALSSGALYEFTFHVLKGETILIASATVLAILFAKGA